MYVRSMQKRHESSKRVYHLLCFLLAFGLMVSACDDTTTSTLLGSGTTSTSGGSPVFAGATAATQLSNGTSIQVTWPTPPTGTAQIKIYSLGNSGLTLLATMPATATNWSQSGLTSGTLYSYVVQAFSSSGVSDGNQNGVSALAYSGINTSSSSPVGATSVSFNSATLNFSAPGANSLGAHVYCVNRTGISTLMATVSNTATTSVSLTGLLSGTTYTCRVQAIVSSTGLDDNNTATYAFQTVSQTFGVAPSFTGSIYEGVALVQAFGDAPTAPTYNTATTTGASITNSVSSTWATPTTRQVNITWNNFNISSPTTATYRLIRVSTGGTIDTNASTPCTASTLTACQVCINSPGSNASNTAFSRTCSDTATTLANPVSGPVIYDYVVSLIVNSSVTPNMAEEIPTGSTASPFRVTVHVPPQNMVLVHRDSANFEMCNLMAGTGNITPDPLNHQRCSYSGLGNVPLSTNAGDTNQLNLPTTYYDFGYDLFVDRFGAACNWTPLASGGMCGAGATTGNCNGNGAPAGTIGVNGNVYYDYNGANCYAKQSGTWYNVNSGSLTTASLAAAYTNVPSQSYQKPPMVDIQQTNAWAVCQSVIGPSDGSQWYGAKRLLRRREQVVAAAYQWLPQEPNNQWGQQSTAGPLSDNSISILENGTAHTTTQACNANTHNGVTQLATFNNATELAGTTAGPDGAFVIGSDYTANCMTRFGLQDMSGNVWTWTSDQLANCSTTTHTCQSTNSPLDEGNRDFTGNSSTAPSAGNPFNFDGTTGPGGTAAGQTSPNYTFQWAFSSPQFGATNFSAPLGLPLVGTNNGNALGIGTTLATAKLHGEYIFLSSDNGNTTRGANVGGSWTYGSGDGRFALALSNAPSFTGSDFGFRCALPAQ